MNKRNNMKKEQITIWDAFKTSTGTLNYTLVKWLRKYVKTYYMQKKRTGKYMKNTIKWTTMKHRIDMFFDHPKSIKSIKTIFIFFYFFYSILTLCGFS